jgi:hypothetical protein
MWTVNVHDGPLSREMAGGCHSTSALLRNAPPLVSARTDSPDGRGLAFSPRRGRAEVSKIPCAKIRNSRGISTLIPLSSPRAKNILLPFYRKM